jgi:hypothetical protein
MSFVFNTVNNSHESIPPSWILLDNKSTIDKFTNNNLLKNIRKVNTPMKIHSTAGVTMTDLVGDFPGYGTVWYHPDGISNILSLARVCSLGYTVKYSINDDNEFVVTKPDGGTRCFKQSEKGLCYLDTLQTASKYNAAFVTTVANNQYKYSSKDYSRAVLARKIQKIIGRPSTQQFIQIISKHLIPNCPILPQDIMAAEDIFGPDKGTLKRKIVRQTPKEVIIDDISLPSHLKERYENIIIAADIMFVNRIAFLVTTSRHIRFATSKKIDQMKNKTILKAIQEVLNIYQGRGFKVTHLLMDGQFESLRDAMNATGVSLNIVARGEHVPEVERLIRTLKERVQWVYNDLPFTKIPMRMLIELVYYCTFWLNSFQNNAGISESLSHTQS